MEQIEIYLAVYTLLVVYLTGLVIVSILAGDTKTGIMWPGFIFWAVVLRPQVRDTVAINITSEDLEKGDLSKVIEQLIKEEEAKNEKR